MKKFFAVMSFLALILSTSAASADYPKYLDKNKAYVLCGMHAGTGWYINRRSIDVKRFDPPYFRLEVEVAVVPRAGEGDLSNVKYIRNEYLYDWSTRKMYRVEKGQKIFIPPYGTIAELPSSYDGELAFCIKYRKRFYGELYADKNTAYSRELYRNVENAEFEEARRHHEGLYK
ncbi:MAG: hypothetical protein IKN27_10495 [Selenomonadaceae bacterium]|nr:hypothetical protein [Selenomonadaceae bacterium]